MEEAAVLEALEKVSRVADKVASTPMGASSFVPVAVRFATPVEAEAVRSAEENKAGAARRKNLKRSRAATAVFSDIDALPIGTELADELIPVEQLRARHAGIASAIRTLNRKLHKYGDSKADDTLDERIKGLEDQFESEKSELEGAVAHLKERIESRRAEIDVAKQHTVSGRMADEQRSTQVARARRVEEQQQELERKRDGTIAALESIQAQIRDAEAVLASSDGTGAGAGAGATGQDVKQLEAEKAGLDERLSRLARELDEASGADVQGSSGVELTEEQRREVETLRGEVGRMRSVSLRAVEAAAKAGSEAGVALRVLGRHEGHMLLEDFKREVCAKTLPASDGLSRAVTTPSLPNGGALQLAEALSGANSAKVLQVLYALVASSLLQIDRSSSQSAVISLVHGQEGAE